MKILIVAALAVVVIATIVFKQNKAASDTASTVQAATATTAVPGETATATGVASVKLPRMVDLGASACIPCKMMKPILDDLMANYADQFTTEFIDVWQDRESGKQYGVEVIPTQIFYDADGKELFRHMGFYSKEDILAKWKELGVEFQSLNLERQ